MDIIGFDGDRSNFEMKKYYWWLLFLIIILGASLRLVKLDSVPPHLGNDEISIAFDSYSVRLIGRDEHGVSWPISFESHQTYKSPLYAYLNMPLNYFLGNTEYGVRTLSAIAGVVSIFMAGMIASIMGGPGVGLITALLMATDPKNIFASRIAYESNVATAVLLIGIWGIINFIIKRQRIWLIVAGLFMGISIWGYHTEWGLVPILLISIPLVFRQTVSIKKWWLMVLVVGLVSLPIYYNFLVVQRSNPNNRASSQLWFSEGQFKDYLKNSHDSLLKKSIKVVTVPVYSYIQHFSFNVNFTSGADLFNDKSPLNSGWFLLATLPMLLVGLGQVKNIFGKWWKFLLVWWLVCPIVPAMTGTVSAVRNLAFIVPTCMIMAAGFVKIWKTYKVGRWLILSLFGLGLGMFLIAYFVHYPLDSGSNFQYGYKQAWEFIKPNINKYDKVVVEDRFGDVGQFSGVPHLYFGYFGAFGVSEMQKRQTKEGLMIDKYIFKYVDWNKEEYQPRTLYIVSAINPKAGSFYAKLVQVGMIRNTDFKPQFLIYETTE